VTNDQWFVSAIALAISTLAMMMAAGCDMTPALLLRSWIGVDKIGPKPIEPKEGCHARSGDHAKFGVGCIQEEIDKEECTCASQR